MKQSYLKKNEKSWPTDLKLLSDCYLSTCYSTSACQFVATNSCPSLPTNECDAGDAKRSEAITCGKAHQQVAALVQDDSRKHCSKGQTYKPRSQMCESVWDKRGVNTEEKEIRANCGGFWANL